MKYFQALLLVTCASLAPLLAQSSFNEQILTEAETALVQQDLTKAYRYLEIAAFGFLDDSDQYARAQMGMALAAAAMKDKPLSDSHMAKVQSLMSKAVTQPKGMPTDLWDRYQILAGLKAPPPPPLPKDVAALKKYVGTNPKVEDGWTALLRAMIGQSSKNDTRARVADAIKAIPDSTAIRALALAFTLNEDNGRDALTHAKALLALRPEDALAHEVLGNQAVKDKHYQEASIHYAKVAKPVIAETAGLQQKLDAAVKQEQKKAEAERAHAKAELEKPKQAPSRQPEANKPKQQPDKTVNTKVPEKQPEPVKAKPQPSPVKQTQTAAVKPSPQSERAPEPAPEEPSRSEKARIDAEIAAARIDATRTPGDQTLQFKLLGLYLEHDRLREAQSLMKQLGGGPAGQSPTYAGYYAQYNFLKKHYKENAKNLGKRKVLDERARVFLGLSYLELGKYQEAAEALDGIDHSQWTALKGVDQLLASKLRNKRSALLRGQRLGRA